MKMTFRSVPVTAALVGCCLALVSCGTDHEGARPTATAAPGSCGHGAGAATTGRGCGSLREFRAYLRRDAPKGDAALASHVLGVRVRTAAGSGRSLATVKVDFGVWDDEQLERTAKVFAHWHRSVYGGHGRVRVLAPAKMDDERDW